MKLENQVCSLDCAKRLKELGIKQESLVYWLNIQHCVHMKVKEDGYTLQEDENGQPIVDKIDYRIELGNPFAWNIDKDNCWSAFTVAELGEMLPEEYISCKTQGSKKDGICREYWLCYEEIDGCDTEKTQMEETEADARAKMLIYLIENKLMEINHE